MTSHCPVLLSRDRKNTFLVGTSAACASALCPPSLESNGEATVVVPVLAHRRQEKMPILDIFASSDHLKSPKRMKSGVNLVIIFAARMPFR